MDSQWRVALVVSIVKTDRSAAEAARTHGLMVAEVGDWREKVLIGAENALRTRPKDEDAVKDEQIKELKQKIGDLVLDHDILREALKPYPLDRKTSDAGIHRGPSGGTSGLSRTLHFGLGACVCCCVSGMGLP